MTGIPIPGGTMAETTAQVARALAAAGLSDAAAEARWLMREALALDTAALLSGSHQTLSDADVASITTFLARRVQHEPLSRIAGRREFYGRLFDVTPATLDPRPDTETLIDAALEMLGAEGRKRPLRILDLGTGTGCILLTLLAELPLAQGVATDVSPEALAVARRNAERLGLAARATFVETDLAEGVEGPFDLVVSNPPYIATSEIAGLAPDVREYDPHLALDGGADGLDFYRRIAREIPRLMTSGLLLLETGHEQAQTVAHLLTLGAAGKALEPARIFCDVAGIPRVVAARTRITA
jgi:release factor glutamine methyltransferase